MRTAFISGTRSGFGFHLAQRLLGLGWRVVAGDPHPDGIAERLCPDEAARERLLVVPLDVRSAASVRAAADAALARGAVDLLVNNAGFAVFGTVEEADLDAIADMVDVNVMGVARVTQALLPSIRAQRGAVVMLSSVAGRTVFPESGYYAATKYAVEAMSEALFQEVASFGVRLRVIEPGSFDTQFLPTAARRSKPRSPESPYAHLQPGWDARKFTMLERPQDPRLVVEAIVASLDDPQPFLRVPVGPDAERLLGLRDRMGADAWVLLAADRNGFEGTRSRRGDECYTADEVLELTEAPAGPRWDATIAAWQTRHLDHWGATANGASALVRIAEYYRRK